jgi:hypothetical protein
VDVDPLASMRCWAITVDLGGREFEIPALPAVDWWPLVSEMSPLAILDILKSDSADGVELDAMLLDGRVTTSALSQVLTDVVEQATGRSLHAAFVLATVANSQWPVIGGNLARRGFRWDVAPIGAALDAVYSVVTEGLEEKNRDKFLALLEDETLSQPGKKRSPSQRVVGEFEAMAGPRPAPAPLPGTASAEPSGSPRPRTRTRPRPPRQGGQSGAPKTRP